MNSIITKIEKIFFLKIVFGVVSIFILDATPMAIIYTFLVALEWDFNSKTSIYLGLFFLFMMFKCIYLFVLYHLALKSKNENVVNFVKKWRTSSSLKLKIILVSLLLVNVVETTLWVNCINVAGVWSSSIISLFQYCFLLSPVSSVIALYIIWILYDVVKNRKFGNDKCDYVENTNNVSISENDLIMKFKRIPTVFSVLLSVVTNNLFSLFSAYRFKNIFGQIKSEKLNLLKKYLKKYLAVHLIITFLFVLGLFLISSNDTLCEKIANLDSSDVILYWEIILFSYLFLYCFFLIFGLYYFYVIYQFVNEALKIIENYAREKYSVSLNYDRVYAFMFGIFYLNYAINTYKDRLTGNLKTSKIMSKINVNCVILLLILLVMCCFVCSLISSSM